MFDRSDGLVVSFSSFLRFGCLVALIAVKDQGLVRAIRTAASSATGLVGGTAVTAFIIGSGSAILLLTPYGWALIIVGTVGGNAFSQMFEYGCESLDNFSRRHPELDDKIQRACKIGSNLFKTIFEQMGYALMND